MLHCAYYIQGACVFGCFMHADSYATALVAQHVICNDGAHILHALHDSLTSRCCIRGVEGCTSLSCSVLTLVHGMVCYYAV